MAKTRKDVIAEASHWVVAHRSNDMTAEQRTSMKAWLRESPSHAKAFAEISDIISGAASAKSLALLEPRSPKPGKRRRAIRRSWGEKMSSRPRLSALAAIASSTAAAVLIMPNLTRADLDAATGIAETRSFVLKDGSRLTLGPKSKISVHFAADKRNVELASGEAFFEVSRDINRPFIVHAGDTQVSVLGTKFDVNHNTQTVSTSVLEGAVQVQEDAPLFGRTSKYLLKANEKIETKADVTLLDRPSHAAVISANTPPGAWREGRLAYSSARLADIIADLNRYYAPGIKLAGTNVREMRVTTSFMENEIDTFLSNLPAILPLAVSRRKSGEVIIAHRNKYVFLD